jgi:xylulokinase
LHYTEKVICTIDIGTSSFKSALWNYEGECLGLASLPLAFTGGAGLRHEADGAQWLRAFEECCRRLRGAAPLGAVEIIVISGNGPSLTPVLGEGSLAREGLRLPAASSRLWLDRRAVNEAAEISSLAGGFVDPSFFLPKALNIKNEEPELYEKTRVFLGCPEYLACALTGEARTVFPAEGFDRWFWTDSLLEKLGLDREKFPPLISPGCVYGPLLPRAADYFGFTRKIPVAAGGPDFFAAIVGAGAARPGLACDRLGTSEGINVCTEKQVVDSRLMSYGHPVKPYWNLSGIISTSGKALEWGRDLLGLSSYDEFFSLAAAAKSGAGGLVFLPYLAGERAPVWDPEARGVLRGLGLCSGRGEFARSVLEGICFAVRDVIEVMEEAGAGVEELRLAGASARNQIQSRIKADISGKPVLIPAQKETELLGLAIIGSRVMGKFDSFPEAADVFVRVESRLEPDRTTAAMYTELFRQYRETYRALKKQAH